MPVEPAIIFEINIFSNIGMYTLISIDKAKVLY